MGGSQTRWLGPDDTPEYYAGMSKADRILERRRASQAVNASLAAQSFSKTWGAPGMTVPKRNANHKSASASRRSSSTGRWHLFTKEKNQRRRNSGSTSDAEQTSPPMDPVHSISPSARRRLSTINHQQHQPLYQQQQQYYSNYDMAHGVMQMSASNGQLNRTELNPASYNSSRRSSIAVDGQDNVSGGLMNPYNMPPAPYLSPTSYPTLQTQFSAPPCSYNSQYNNNAQPVMMTEEAVRKISDVNDEMQMLCKSMSSSRLYGGLSAGSYGQGLAEQW